MKYQLPPLNGLRAFEAAARHLSFKEAARELFVTPGAISQQIKHLEDDLGQRLFQRVNRTIRLTEVGRLLLPAVSDAFQGIADALARLRTDEVDGPLTVSVLPSLAVKWLVPRLGRFRARHPQIDVRISASPRFVNFDVEDVDLAVRHGMGHWAGLTAVWLMPGDLFPVCSPELLKSGPPLRTPQDLRLHTLLHTETRDEWPLWLRMHGVSGIDPLRGPSFSDDGMVVQSAIEGQGVALGRSALVAEDLHQGRLIKPFDLSMPSALAYYLVYPEGHENRPKIAAFRAWILEEAARSPVPVAVSGG
ncbi:MAG: transcriptional regulator GcvA [Candidatus Lambdaproteobacteria bacterium]|nr:transcriptional regulator GcvA [Candidatus Lambdaproteobacteria bacterium]